jgi:hypothetical protein
MAAGLGLVTIRYRLPRRSCSRWAGRTIASTQLNGQSAGPISDRNHQHAHMTSSLRTFGLGRRILQTLPLLCLLGLSGCGGGEANCEDSDEPYLAAGSNAPLKVPDGLTLPDRSAALEVPAGSGAKPKSAACLAQAPSYFRSSGMVARSPEEVVASWAQAWANREADGVVALYSTTFVAPTDSAGSAAWLDQRREQVAVGPLPEARIEGLKIDSDGADRRVATFTQRFGTNTLQKELVLVREAGSWRIAAEKVVEVK